ncbi:MAG: PepSY domain-containing protein [Acidimicrobiia bacterium]|nr:PepSY domain-containing protein [Acidimicrobiia bacterium]
MQETRLRKRLTTIAMVLGVAAGSAAIAGATSQTPAPTAPAEDSVEIQEPSYTGSIQAPAEDETLTDAEEEAQLAGLATITPDDAAAAANAAVAGEVVEVELDDENGSVVYSVEIVDANGVQIDVKVDAGDGTILDQQADDDADEGADGADDDDVQHENENEGDNDADAGHED